MKAAHHNKREKISSLLFDLAKYLLTVIGVGAILPESRIPFWTAVLGGVGALILLALAVVITPEERG